MLEFQSWLDCHSYSLFVQLQKFSRWFRIIDDGSIVCFLLSVFEFRLLTTKEKCFSGTNKHIIPCKHPIHPSDPLKTWWAIKRPLSRIFQRLTNHIQTIRSGEPSKKKSRHKIKSSKHLLLGSTGTHTTHFLADSAYVYIFFIFESKTS